MHWFRARHLLNAVLLGFIANALVTLVIAATLDPFRYSGLSGLGPVAGEHWHVEHLSRPGAERVTIQATPVINRGTTEIGPVEIVPRWAAADPTVPRLLDGDLQREDHLEARGWPMLCAVCTTRTTVVREDRADQNPFVLGGVALPLPPWSEPFWSAGEPRVLPLSPLWTGLLVNWAFYTVLAMLTIALVRQRRWLRPYLPRPRPIGLVASATVAGFLVTVLVMAGLAAFADPYRYPALGVPGGDDETGEYWTIWSVSRPGLESASIGLERMGRQKSLITRADALPAWLANDPVARPLEDDLDARAGQFAARGWPALCARYTIRTTEIGRDATQRETGIAYGLTLPLAPWSSPSGIGLGSEPRVIPLRPIWGGLVANWLVYGALSLLALVVIRQQRYARRKRRGRCVACGYDLRGEYERGCTECGWKAPGGSVIPDEPPPTPDAPATPAGT